MGGVFAFFFFLDFASTPKGTAVMTNMSAVIHAIPLMMAFDKTPSRFQAIVRGGSPGGNLRGPLTRPGPSRGWNRTPAFY